MEHQRRAARAAASTPASTGPIRGSATPTAWAAGRAGLATGPRKLNTVGTPSSRRGTAVCRSAGWYSGANRNDHAGLLRQLLGRGRRQVDHHAERLEHVGGPARRRRGPVSVLGHPGAGRGRDDRAHRRDVDRPGPVAAGADQVDEPSGNRAASAWSSMAAASPATSAGVSPFIRSATPNPAIWVGRGRALHDLVHRPGGLVCGERLALDQRADQRGPGVRGP